ncbi:MAG TPA: hypothetical protein DCQ64_31025 [Candidatus Rokubacteria bacterium]|nr:hypothetical protein [Candidatus Rokubacteria bacterium]
MGSLKQAAEIMALREQVKALAARLDGLDARTSGTPNGSGQRDGKRQRPRGKKRGKPSRAEARAAAGQGPHGDSGE